MKNLLPALLGLLLMAAPAVAVHAAPKKPLAAPKTVPKAAASAHLGVYRWGAPKGPDQVSAFAAWIGRPDVWAEDFEASDQWGNVREPTSWQFAPWQKWLAERKGRRLILTVPMLVGGWDLKGPTTGPGAGQPVSLKQGAAGEYNDYYKTLATNLVGYGLGRSIIRLGHEFNGGWYTWRAKDDPASFVTYFKNIVTTMRAVPGAEKLQFCWNPAYGYQQFPAEQAWPGDAYVDYVGLDLYDESWAPETYPLSADAPAADVRARRARAWESLSNGDHGLAWWQKFAATHKKPFALPEWGVSRRADGHGGLDNPDFIAHMHEYMTRNPVAWHVYFDVNAGDGAHQVSPGSGAEEKPPFPQSAAKFKALFGAAPQQKAGKAAKYHLVTIP